MRATPVAHDQAAAPPMSSPSSQRRSPLRCILVTGGVTSDVGKGSCAATLGRIAALALEECQANAREHCEHSHSQQHSAASHAAANSPGALGHGLDALPVPMEPPAASFPPPPPQPRVRYVKLEPCLQFAEGLRHGLQPQPHSSVGGECFEVVADPDATGNRLLYDSDVGRARFLIPGFRPAATSTCHVSLGEIKLGALLELRNQQIAGGSVDGRRSTASDQHHGPGGRCPSELQLYAAHLRRLLGLEPAATVNEAEPVTADATEDAATAAGFGHVGPPATGGDRATRVASAASVLVAEVGGTAGEREHTELCAVLLAALGVWPCLHVHVTALLHGPAAKSKPAQLCLQQLLAASGSHGVAAGGHALAPDIVLVRHESITYDSVCSTRDSCDSDPRAAPGLDSSAPAAWRVPPAVAAALSKLAAPLGVACGWRVLPVPHDTHFPERAYVHCLAAQRPAAAALAAALRSDGEGPQWWRSVSTQHVLAAARREAAGAFALPPASIAANPMRPLCTGSAASGSSVTATSGDTSCCNMRGADVDAVRRPAWRNVAIGLYGRPCGHAGGGALVSLGCDDARFAMLALRLRAWSCGTARVVFLPPHAPVGPHGTQPPLECIAGGPSLCTVAAVAAAANAAAAEVLAVAGAGDGVDGGADADAEQDAALMVVMAAGMDGTRGCAGGSKEEGEVFAHSGTGAHLCWSVRRGGLAAAALRPDWMGTLDHPEGQLADFAAALRWGHWA